MCWQYCLFYIFLQLPFKVMICGGLVISNSILTFPWLVVSEFPVAHSFGLCVLLCGHVSKLFLAKETPAVYVYAEKLLF
jgi:hypothetical protein